MTKVRLYSLYLPVGRSVCRLYLPSTDKALFALFSRYLVVTVFLTFYLESYWLVSLKLVSLSLGASKGAFMGYVIVYGE